MIELHSGGRITLGTILLGATEMEKRLVLKIFGIGRVDSIDKLDYLFLGSIRFSVAFIQGGECAVP